MAALFLTMLACSAQPEPARPPLDLSTHTDEVNRWSAVREDWLTSATGPFSQTGLCHVTDSELPAPIGSDTATTRCLVPGPRAAGTIGQLVAQGDSLVLQADGGLFWVGEKSIREAHVLAVRDEPMVDGAAAWHGSVRLTARWAEGEITVWIVDTLAEARSNYNGLRRWPIDTTLVFEGRFEAAVDDWRQVPTVRGFDIPRQVAGTITIEFGGEPVSLTALTKGRGGTSWLVVFRDPTSDTEESYPAGRFLDVAFADSSGHTVIDFNRARNPDCAFTDASPCPLPPPENWFDERIEAGELKYQR